MDLLHVCCNCRDVWEEVLLSIPQAIVVARADGQIVFASAAVEKQMGFLPHELTGKDLSTILTPEDWTYLYPNLLSLTQRQEIFEDELMLMRKDKTRFMAFMVLRPCFDPIEGDTIAIISIQDIDRQKQMEKSFRQNHYEDLVSIANGIAHELRNPLVGIGGFVNRLFKTCETIHNHSEYYGHIMTNLNKIENLIKKVESYARLPKPNFADLFTTRLIERAIEPNLERIKQRDIHLDVDVDEHHLRMDGDMLTRAVSILIENAVDALPTGGRLQVQCKVHNNRCTIVVADNGSGILPQDLSSIFNPLFSTKPDGAGIDLALAKRIAENHGGKIRVESKYGEGSTFRIELPVERRRSIRTNRLDS